MLPGALLLILTLTAGVKLGLKLALLKRLKPALKLKMLVPAVKGAALFSMQNI